MKNPHLPSEWRGHGPNQRHQDWESGHAIGYSKGLREGMESSDRVHVALHRIALQALKAANKYTYVDSKAIAALEAAVKGD